MNTNISKTHIKLALALMVAGVGTTVAHSAWTAVVPDGSMFYSGDLLQNGVPMEGTQDITVSFLTSPTATSPVCTAAVVKQPIHNGKFRFPLPKNCADAARANPSLYATVDVGTTRIGQATPIGAVPYAIAASSADTANTATSAKSAANATNATHADTAANTDRAARVQSSDGAPLPTGDLGIYSQSGGQWVRIVSTGGPIKLFTDGATDPIGHAPGLTLNTDGRLSATPSAYILSANDTQVISCNAGDMALSGGAACHEDWDQMLAESNPIASQGETPTGWSGLCMNHNNSGIQKPPRTVYVVCMRKAG